MGCEGGDGRAVRGCGNMAGIAFSRMRGVAVRFGCAVWICRRRAVTGVAIQRIAGIEIHPMIAVITAIIGPAAVTILVAVVTTDGGERIHDLTVDVAGRTGQPHGQMVRVLAGITAPRKASTMLMALAATSRGASGAIVIHPILMVGACIGGIVLEMIGQGVADLAKAVFVGAGIDEPAVGIKKLDVVRTRRAVNFAANQLPVDQTEMGARMKACGDIAVNFDCVAGDIRDFEGAATEAIGQNQNQAAISGATLGRPRAGSVSPVVFSCEVFNLKGG